MRKATQRGAYRRDECVFIGAWVPAHVIAALDQAVKIMDLDRSKFLRKALEEKIRSKEVGA